MKSPVRLILAGLLALVACGTDDEPIPPRAPDAGAPSIEPSVDAAAAGGEQRRPGPAGQAPVRSGVAGRVLGPDGKVVVGASVTLQRMLSPWPERNLERLESSYTGPNGRFEFETPRGDDLLVEVTHPELSRQRVVAPEAVEMLTIQLRHGFEVTGYVLSSGNQPVANCLVSLEPSLWSTRRAIVTRTDETGWFQFSNVDAGTDGIVRLTARDALGRFAPATLPAVAIGSGEQLSLKFQTIGRALFGKVVQSGELGPVEGAEVRAYPSTAWNGGLYVPYTTRTDRDGNFRLRGLSSGNVRIEVRHDEYSTASRVINVGRSSTKLQFELIGRSKVTGRAIGDEVAGTELILTTQAAEMARATVGADGRFTFPGDFSSGGGRVEVAGGARSFVQTAGRSVRVTIEDVPTTELELELGPPSKLVGTVVDESGEPIAGVLVSARRHPFDARNPERLVSVTDEAGEYGFGSLPAGYPDLLGLPSGDVDLLFEHSDYATVIGSASLAGPGATSVAEPVTLVRPGSVRGRITRAGKPLAGATVFAGRGALSSTSAVSGPDGRYELRRLAPGRYRVMARYATLSLEVASELSQVESGVVIDGVDIEFAGGRPVRGYVVDPEGLGVENALVLLVGRTGSFVATDPSGSFALEVPEGEAELLVFSPDYRIRVREPVPAAGDLVNVRLPLVNRGTVTARVLGLPDRKPVTTGVVRIVALEDRPEWTENERRQRNPQPRWISMSGGKLTLSSFPAGRSRLVIQCPGYGPYVSEIELGRRETRSLGQILLEPGAGVRGVVRNDAGEPVPGAAVHLGDMEDLFDESADPSILTDAEGHFTISGVTSDSHRIVVAAPGYSIRTVDVRLPDDLLRADRIPVELERCSTIDVQLFAGEEKLEGLRLVAVYRAGIIMEVRPTDLDGRYSFLLRGPGRYQVVEFGGLLEDAVEVDVGEQREHHAVALQVAK